MEAEAHGKKVYLNLFLMYNYYGDNMKVHTKIENKSETPIWAILVFLILNGFSIFIYWQFLFNEKTFLENLSHLGMELLFAIFFTCITLSIIYRIIKKPTRIKAKLIKKEKETYYGLEITDMFFREYYPDFSSDEKSVYSKYNIENDEENIKIEDNGKYRDYECYTEGSNNLTVNNFYTLTVKEDSGKVIEVDEYDGLEKNIKKETIFSKITIVHVLIAFVFGAPSISCVLGIFLYPEYRSIYISVLTLIIFGVLFIHMSKK